MFYCIQIGKQENIEKQKDNFSLLTGPVFAVNKTCVFSVNLYNAYRLHLSGARRQKGRRVAPVCICGCTGSKRQGGAAGDNGV